MRSPFFSSTVTPCIENKSTGTKVEKVFLHLSRSKSAAKSFKTHRTEAHRSSRSLFEEGLVQISTSCFVEPPQPTPHPPPQTLPHPPSLCRSDSIKTCRQRNGGNGSHIAVLRFSDSSSLGRITTVYAASQVCLVSAAPRTSGG